MKADNTKLEQELMASRKENDLKTKQIAKLMVDYSKEELLKVQNTTTIKEEEKLKHIKTPSHLSATSAIILVRLNRRLMDTLSLNI